MRLAFWRKLTALPAAVVKPPLTNEEKELRCLRSLGRDRYTDWSKVSWALDTFRTLAERDLCNVSEDSDTLWRVGQSPSQREKTRAILELGYDPNRWEKWVKEINALAQKT